MRRCLGPEPAEVRLADWNDEGTDLMKIGVVCETTGGGRIGALARLVGRKSECCA